MAVTLQVKIDGLNETLSALNSKSSKVSQAKSLAIERIAILLRDSITKFAGAGHPEHPEVQSGRLRSSIRYRMKNESTAVVGSDMGDGYAAFVEFGHSQEAGRFVPALGKRLVANSVKPYPFVRPAILEVVDGGQAKRVAENTVKEVLG